jgi:hypothetical protein
MLDLTDGYNRSILWDPPDFKYYSINNTQAWKEITDQFDCDSIEILLSYFLERSSKREDLNLVVVQAKYTS